MGSQPLVFLASAFSGAQEEQQEPEQKEKWSFER